MPRSLRPIGHEDRLSLVDHLDELRMRLFICAGVVAVAFAFCFWQNHELLRIINKPLVTQTRKQVAKGEGTVFSVNADGTGFTTLYSFSGDEDGANPNAGLLLASNNLYGATINGGANSAGTVFILQTNGTEFTTLFNFNGGSDGANPEAGLISDAAGNIAAGFWVSPALLGAAACVNLLQRPPANAAA